MFDNLDDPKQQALLMAAMGLLGGGGGKGFGGFARDVSRAGLLGLQGYNQASMAKDRRAEEEQQRQMRQMQMDQMRQGMDWQKAMASGYRPGAPGVTPLTPNDDNGNPMPGSPAVPPGFDFSQAMKVDPFRTMQAQQSLQPKRDYKVVGNTLVGIRGDEVKPAFTAPTQDSLPSGMRMGANGPEWIPGYLEGKRGVAAAGATSVNVGGPVMEKEEHKGKAQLNMKGFEELQHARRTAVKENSLIESMLRNPVDTNKAAPVTITAKAWLGGLGITGDRFNESVSNAQFFNAAAKEMVLNRQLLQKGPQTESDARRLEETVASLGNTKDANKAILAFSKAQNNRAIAQANFWDKYWKEKGTLEGVEEAWYAGEGSKSIWDTPELKGYQGAKVIDFNSLPPR